jgi:hypothetical protein
MKKFLGIILVFFSISVKSQVIVPIEIFKDSIVVKKVKNNTTILHNQFQDYVMWLKKSDTLYNNKKKPVRK